VSARVAVVRFAGVNCEEESARAVRAAGLAAEIVPWTSPAAALSAFDAYLLPGGFSYQDRVRAGAVAARHELVEVIRSRAAAGAPVLGICNGAQVLVEAGLVPGEESTTGEERVAGEEATPARLGAALAPNRMPGRSGYLARWVGCRVTASRSLFTQAYAPGEVVPLPMAHAEGRFTTRDEAAWERIEKSGAVVMRYAALEKAGATSSAQGDGAGHSANPNGSLGDAAAVGNAAGNVLALMPHPERAQSLLQVPLDLAGPWGERRRRVSAGQLEGWSAGPGAGIFVSLAGALGVIPALPGAGGAR
jgi:phosphoribosylformylglycinamidine synthase